MAIWGVITGFVVVAFTIVACGFDTYTATMPDRDPDDPFALVSEVLHCITWLPGYLVRCARGQEETVQTTSKIIIEFVLLLGPSAICAAVGTLMESSEQPLIANLLTMMIVGIIAFWIIVILVGLVSWLVSLNWHAVAIVIAVVALVCILGGGGGTAVFIIIG